MGIPLTLATDNPGKIEEIRQLLGDAFSVTARPAIPSTVEDGATLSDNALKKAREVFEVVSTLTLADDTGLFVDALDGKPGVRTARFAGPGADSTMNIEKLLLTLASHSDRAAKFVTCIALISATGQDVVYGEVTGQIALEPRGASGFGYDPVFIPDGGDGRTFAEMDPSEKNRHSHRQIALDRARSLLVT